MIKELLITTGIELISFIGLIILVGLILQVLETATNRNFIRAFGKNSLIVTGIIGVPVHELSHAVMALVFFHRINEIKLFQRPDENGVMGYVKHSYRSKNIYHQVGNFFIGIAPILGGTAFIMLLSYWLLPEVLTNYFDQLSDSQILLNPNGLVIFELLKMQFELLKNIFMPEHFKELPFYLFIYLGISIASHMSLSLADLKGALQGLLVIMVIFLIVNLLGINELTMNQIMLHYNLFLLSILAISVLFSLFSFLLSLIFSRIFR